MTVELWIAVQAEDDIEELHSLFEALAEDDELRSASMRLTPGARHEQTLGAEEIIHLVVDSAPLWGALGTSVTAWLHMRRPQLTIKITRPDGLTAEINATGDRAVESAHVTQAIELLRGTKDEAS